jgi:multidrug efflux pump subunit AcrA (membrane-fusion protein)
MKTFVLTLIASTMSFIQQSEPVVSKDSISIHTVRRGNMPLRLVLQGTVISMAPAKAVVSGPWNAAGFLKVGQAVDFEIQGRRIGGSLPVISGKVTRIESNNSTDSIRAAIDFVASLPEGTAAGTRIGALLDTGEELRDIVLFDRPADARPNTDAAIFVIEPGDEYAKRVTVRYGRQSGAQIEIISGLVPGDRVIVTDMSAWTSYPRVRLK